ncbi:hypothetical protein Pyn_39754 [Prunus yedoensis var. nudiflora]|uniref:Uncharacterized protein n=1 Tax=Prunus yedoensis var. nudiflora TaxID=2094558 RepID=A0A314V4H5_PRUYE|nr:hypothetical protein Pyn_39754 [Prunus yedoensis var. nudiflora]
MGNWTVSAFKILGGWRSSWHSSVAWCLPVASDQNNNFMRATVLATFGKIDPDLFGPYLTYPTNHSLRPFTFNLHLHCLISTEAACQHPWGL